MSPLKRNALKSTQIFPVKLKNTCMSLGLNSLFHINGIHGPHIYNDTVSNDHMSETLKILG